MNRTRYTPRRTVASLVGLFFSFHVHSCIGLRIAVFGGSGFVGRRVCKTLVDCGHTVTSVSTSGRPPSYYHNMDGTGASWVDKVEWVSHNVVGIKQKFRFAPSEDENVETHNKNFEAQAQIDAIAQRLAGPNNEAPIDAAISCVGNIQPNPSFTGLFGLFFDYERMRYENGAINEQIVHMCKAAGAKRFVYVSVNYETAKALEGAVEGYIDGKRLAESTACHAFGKENTIVLGPSLIYGGNRLPVAGPRYRSFVESPITKNYVKSQDAIRGISAAPIEDWVEKMIFTSPPVDVQCVARVIAAGAVDLINKEMVGARKQGFFDNNGKKVLYDDFVQIDGAYEIERLDAELNLASNDLQVLRAAEEGTVNTPTTQTQESTTSVATEGEAPYGEGVFIGKKPYFFPLGTFSILGVALWSAVTGQFVGGYD